MLQENVPESIRIERKQLFASLGVDLDRREFLDLSNVSPEELYELMMKSLMWMEYVSEVLSRAKKLRLDGELKRDAILNRALAESSSGKRVAEAKASARNSQDFFEAEESHNTLVAYSDYLERLLINLDKYHYVMKSRMESLRGIERKY